MSIWYCHHLSQQLTHLKVISCCGFKVVFTLFSQHYFLAHEYTHFIDNEVFNEVEGVPFVHHFAYSVLLLWLPWAIYMEIVGPKDRNRLTCWIVRDGTSLLWITLAHFNSVPPPCLDIFGHRFITPSEDPYSEVDNW